MTADPAFWNALAEEYARKPVERPEAFERKIAHTRERITPTSVVLDIGCGTGSLALRLAPGAAHVHGLDMSSEMVRIARTKAAASSTSNVTFHEGPFDEAFTAFEDGSLDGICAYSILHLVDDHRAALARIARLLEPGGFLVSSTPCLGESWVPYRPVLWALRKMGKAPMVKIISRQQLAVDMRAAGFVDLTQPDVGAGPHIAFVLARRA